MKGGMSMGLYIKGMEMPTSCWFCHFQDCGNCVLNNHKVVDNCIMEDRRDDDCPLVPVPPHGDLIDRDALNTDEMIEVCINGNSYGHEWNIDEWLNAAPIIIPAEPPKEES